MERKKRHCKRRHSNFAKSEDQTKQKTTFSTKATEQIRKEKTKEVKHDDKDQENKEVNSISTGTRKRSEQVSKSKRNIE